MFKYIVLAALLALAAAEPKPAPAPAPKPGLLAQPLLTQPLAYSNAYINPYSLYNYNAYASPLYNGYYRDYGYNYGYANSYGYGYPYYY